MVLVFISFNLFNGGEQEAKLDEHENISTVFIFSTCKKSIQSVQVVVK